MVNVIDVNNVSIDPLDTNNVTILNLDMPYPINIGCERVMQVEILDSNVILIWGFRRDATIQKMEVNWIVNIIDYQQEKRKV